MSLHRKVLFTGGGLLAAGVIILVYNFSYMYDLLGKCVEKTSCSPYPYWDVINAAALIAAASGLVLVVIGVVMTVRAADRADDAAEQAQESETAPTPK